jgi:hypothetical protein
MAVSNAKRSASTVTEVASFSSRQVSESTTEGALCILGFSNENGAAQVSVAQLVERGYYPFYPYKSL